MQTELNPSAMASSRRHPLMRAIRILFLVAAIGAGIALLWDERSALLSALAKSKSELLLLGLVCGFGNLASAGCSWFILLRNQQNSLSPANGARIFALGQIGKYLPGGVWSFVASAELGRDAGFERRTIVASFLLALIIGLATGAILAFISLPEVFAPTLTGLGWLWLLLAAPLVLIHPAARRVLEQITGFEPFPRSVFILGSIILAVAGWSFAGLQIYLFLIALGQSIGAESLIYLTGIYAASWIIGFLFVIAPAGLGPREATMIAMLSTLMPITEATIVALFSRVAMTMADVIGAGTVTIFLKQKVEK